MAETFVDVMQEAVAQANKVEQVLCCARHDRPLVENDADRWACQVPDCSTEVIWRDI